MTQTIISKAEFAMRKGRKPSAVSNWIAEGKISKAALIGEGVRARIWVEQAEADLVRSLDESQQMAQLVPANTAPITTGPAPVSEADELLTRRRTADADRAEHEAKLANLKLQREAGNWIEVSTATRMWGKELSTLIGEIEVFIVRGLARTIADEFNLDYKAVAVLARDKWHEHRRAAAEAAREGLEAPAETEEGPADESAG